MDAAIKRIQSGGARVTLKAPLKTPSEVLEEDGVADISKLTRGLLAGPTTTFSKITRPRNSNEHRNVSGLVQFPRHPDVGGRHQIQ